jgi:hypothetical protein
MDLEALFIKHGAASFDKQIYLRAMVGKAGWGFDIQTGVLAFRRPHEEPLQLNAQILGSESDDAHTWLWAWANPTNGYKREFLASAESLRQMGEREGIAAFTEAEQPMTAGINGARLAAIASGELRAGCYFRAPYPRGSLYLLIRDPRFKRPVTQPIPRILKAFPMFLSDYPVRDVRSALLHYLAFYRLDVSESATRVEARANQQARSVIGAEVANLLIAEFDAAGRLTTWDGLVVP